MKWLEKYDILDPDHEHSLERSSAKHEFHNGHVRANAEQIAYDEYKRQHMLKAAAYHLDGMDSSKARGDSDGAKSHYSMFTLHCKGLGMNPQGSISAEIQAQRGMGEKLAKFTPHPADTFVLEKP